MESTIANTNPIPPSASAPMPQAPSPMAQPMPQAPSPMGGVAPMGGMPMNGAYINNGGGGIKAWFKDINILDVTISAFIVGGIIYAVQYYRFMMMLEKTGYADLNSRIAKLESSIAAQKAEMNASGNMDRMRRRPVMRLG
jgi:predicted lipid-binding transport protein (Tim44 family)